MLRIRVLSTFARDTTNRSENQRLDVSGVLLFLVILTFIGGVNRVVLANVHPRASEAIGAGAWTWLREISRASSGF